MHFDVSHTFSGTDVATFERLYFDEPFNIALCEAVGLQRRLVSLTQKGDQLRRVVEVVANREIPAAVSKVLGSTSIAYTETIHYDGQAHRGSWSTASNIMSDKISSSGDLIMTSSPQGAVRRVTGDVTVRLFGLGGLVERFIVADVVSSYGKAAAFTEQHLASIGR